MWFRNFLYEPLLLSACNAPLPMHIPNVFVLFTRTHMVVRRASDPLVDTFQPALQSGSSSSVAFTLAHSVCVRACMLWMRLACVRSGCAKAMAWIHSVNPYNSVSFMLLTVNDAIVPLMRLPKWKNRGSCIDHWISMQIRFRCNSLRNSVKVNWNRYFERASEIK